jgi:hypothetical protein
MINVSFVGSGGMAAHYVDVYRSLEYVRLVNTIDPAVQGASRDFADALKTRDRRRCDLDAQLSPPASRP